MLRTRSLLFCTSHSSSHACLSNLNLSLHEKSGQYILSRPEGGSTYEETWGLDWLLDFNGHIAYNSRLQFTVEISLVHTVCPQFTIQAMSPLGLLPHANPLVPGYNGGRSPSWFPELSVLHSHSDSLCTFNLELSTPISYCSVCSSVQ
jgi:hypothetical protein